MIRGIVSKMRRTIVISLSLFVALLLQAADPAYSGSWRLNASRSDPRVPSGAAESLKLSHQGLTMTCEAMRAGSPAENCSYTIDGKETKHLSGRERRSTIAKWEGDAVILNTIVLKEGIGQQTVMDRWSLSRDGNTLRVHRQIVSAQGESEAQLVYEREGAHLATRSEEKSAPRAADSAYLVARGTRIPLALINSVSTRHGAPGDRIYLQTVYPVLVDGRIVIPPGSFVNGTVTEVKRPGRVKGRAELYVRFDSLMLPNGALRDFRARVGSLDGRANEELDREEGRIKGEGNKSGDARTIGEAAGAGTSVGVIAGSVAGHAAMGAGIGAAAGAAAGLAGVLLSRGPEAQLAAGSVVEMVLDRDLQFTTEELDRPAPPQGQLMTPGTGPSPSIKDRRPGSRFPL
jgi:hypothetical protein